MCCHGLDAFTFLQTPPGQSREERAVVEGGTKHAEWKRVLRRRAGWNILEVESQVRTSVALAGGDE